MSAHLEREASHSAPTLVGRGPAVGCSAETTHNLADQVVLGAHIGPASSNGQAAQQHRQVRFICWHEAGHARLHLGA